MPRSVDKLPKPSRVRPMKVIGLGPSRTGTLGLTAALKTLGHHPFHITELLPHGLQEMNALQEAIIAETTDKPFARQEYDRMWAEYDCIIESPCYLSRSVIAAYIADPEVKFILTERSATSFAKSLSGSLCAYNTELNKLPLSFARHYDGFVRELSALFSLMTARWARGAKPASPDFQEMLKKSYIEYIAEVKASIPADRLLVLQLERGFGWEEICSFLGCPIPETEYPRLNTMSEFTEAAEMIVGPARTKASNVLGCLGGLVTVAAAMGVWWLQRRR